MTIRVLGGLGVIASMFAASCLQDVPGDVSSEGTATQADQANQELEPTGEELEPTGEALESTGDVQQAQEVLNKYMLCYRIAFSSTKFACT